MYYSSVSGKDGGSESDVDCFSLKIEDCWSLVIVSVMAPDTNTAAQCLEKMEGQTDVDCFSLKLVIGDCFRGCQCNGGWC